MKAAQHSAEDIAQFFIDLANHQYIDEGVSEGITNLKLQKILYFAQAAHLSMYGGPLFDDEIEAWKFGPVVVSVYDKYKGSGAEALPSPDSLPELPDGLVMFLESIWNIYGKFSAHELVTITHNHRPWKDAYFGGAGRSISKEVLMEYYKRYFVPEETENG